MNLQNEQMNINVNNNNNIQQNNNTSNKYVFGIILFITIFISSCNIYQFFYIINTIKKVYLSVPFKIFEECYLFHYLSDLFVEFLSFCLGIDIIFLIILPIIQMFIETDVFISKFFGVFLYFNYIIFGPFFLGCLILGIKYNKKIMYICSNIDPEKKFFNRRLFFVYILSLSLSSLMSFFGFYFFENNYFNNSIKIKRNGNYIIGHFFWLKALEKSRNLRNRNILNNNNEINLINGGDQDENQNLI